MKSRWIVPFTQGLSDSGCSLSLSKGTPWDGCPYYHWGVGFDKLSQPYKGSRWIVPLMLRLCDKKNSSERI